MKKYIRTIKFAFLYWILTQKFKIVHKYESGNLLFDYETLFFYLVYLYSFRCFPSCFMFMSCSHQYTYFVFICAYRQNGAVRLIKYRTLIFYEHAHLYTRKLWICMYFLRVLWNWTKLLLDTRTSTSYLRSILGLLFAKLFLYKFSLHLNNPQYTANGKLNYF